MTILENYLKSKKVQKTLSTKPGEEGFSLIELVVVIAVLAILSAVAIPAFNGVQANARASAAKNGLVNVVKECIVLGTDNDSTNDNLDSSATFAGDFRGYTLDVLSGSGLTTASAGSCYQVEAIPDAGNSATESEFSITLNSDGSSTKTCTNPAAPDVAPGCSSAGTW
jgi:prepilin-type N-terminal cleavage/methylation domain-containing protein